MRKLLFLAPIVVFGGLAVLFWRGLGLDPSKVPSPLIDKPAPAMALPPLVESKGGIAAADFRGKVTLVNFFASWCVPCRAEHPLLMGLAGRDDFALVGVNYKDKPEDALKWLLALGDPYERIGVDADGRTAIEWGVYGVPESYLIDREGRVRFKQIGPFTEQDIAEKLIPLLRELSP